MKKSKSATVAVARAKPPRNETSIPAAVAEAFGNLPPREARAFEVLSAGGTIVAAAAAAGVVRQTVHEWLLPGGALAGAIDVWKKSLADNARTRLLILGQQATTTIANAIRNGDTRAALAVVKSMGLLAAPPTGESLHQTTATLKRDQAARALRQTADEQRHRDFAAAVANDDWLPDDDPIPDEPAPPSGDAENPIPADEPLLDGHTKDPT